MKTFIGCVFFIKCKNVVKNLAFVLCLGWLIFRTFHASKNTSESESLKVFLHNKDKGSVESEMLRRKSVVAEVCSREGLGELRRENLPFLYPKLPNYAIYYFDSINKLMWCPIYKSASTSWLYNLCNLAGKSDAELDNLISSNLLEKIARKYYPSLKYEDAAKIVNKTLKFFIVRHPFDRLLSAYRDKLEKVTFSTDKIHESQFYYKTFGKEIVKRYRNASSYPEKGKYNDERDRSIDSHFNASIIEPTFEEFVMFLVDSIFHQMDDHWIPYFIYCMPCSLEYDVIAKFETLYDDQRYLIEKANLQGKIFPKWKRKTKGGLSSSTAKKYFSTLSRDLLLKLYDKYRIDFEMFEYSIKEHLTYVA